MLPDSLCVSSTGCVELSPDLGFIQPGVDFVLQMKFRPSADLAVLCGDYAIQNQDGSHTIAVPVQVTVPNQVSPSMKVVL